MSPNVPNEYLGNTKVSTNLIHWNVSYDPSISSLIICKHFYMVYIKKMLITSLQST